MRRLLFLLLLFDAFSHAADVIPANRRMDWGSVVGVPGGVPSFAGRTKWLDLTDTVACAAAGITPAAGDGVTDDRQAFAEAMQYCPKDQYINLPAGTYVINSQATVSQSQHAVVSGLEHGFFTLRGAGIGQTILKMTGTTGGFVIGSIDLPQSTSALSVTDGATAGSTVVTVADTTTVTVNKFITVWAATPSWMHTLNTGGSDADPTFQVVFKVLSKTGTDVTFTPPIPFDVSGMTPKIMPWGGSVKVFNNVGVEDLTFDCSTQTAGVLPIIMNTHYGSWIKNVEVSGVLNKSLQLQAALRCEVRHCYIHGCRGTGPNHEGLNLYGLDCWNLVEDNITINGFPCISLSDAAEGCVGNVIAYNYATGVSAVGVAGFSISDSHGYGAFMNLYEGNHINGFTAGDGYFGCSSYGTAARNVITNNFPGLDNPIAFHAAHYSDYWNVAGNILGTSGNGSVYQVSGTSYLAAIYRLGYPNSGSNSYGGGAPNLEGETIGPTTPPDYTSSPTGPVNRAQALDLNVEATLIRKGNWNTVDAAIPASEALGSDIVANSYYTTKAASELRGMVWGVLTFPPYDSSNPSASSAQRIPAGYRYTNGQDPTNNGTITMCGLGHTTIGGSGHTTFSSN